MSKPICYISGPMTGMEDFNRKAFFEVAGFLGNTYTVLNPATLPNGLEYEDYMRIDLAMVSVSNVLFLLPGREDSNGARRELEHFVKLGKFEIFVVSVGVYPAYTFARFEDCITPNSSSAYDWYCWQRDVAVARNNLNF